MNLIRKEKENVEMIINEMNGKSGGVLPLEAGWTAMTSLGSDSILRSVKSTLARSWNWFLG